MIRSVCTAFTVAGIAVCLFADPLGADPARDARIDAVLDQYMDALNDLDLERHVATYHFPHFRFASGKLAVWETRSEAMPLLELPVAERRTHLRRSLGEGWQRSEWTRRDIVQADATKVHVVTRFERHREDGSLISSHDSLYILTFENDRWGIKGRSSFAP